MHKRDVNSGSATSDGSFAVIVDGKSTISIFRFTYRSLVTACNDAGLIFIYTLNTFCRAYSTSI